MDWRTLDEQEQAWTELAQRWGGHFEPGDGERGGAVAVNRGPWTFRLEGLTVSAGPGRRASFTSFVVPFVNPRHLRFQVYRAGFFDGVAKALGAQDVEIGDARFDADYMIKSTDEAAVRALLTPEIRARLRGAPRLALHVVDDRGWFGAKTFPDDVDALSLRFEGLVADVELLDQLFGLFAAVLEQLALLGYAAPRPPQLHPR
jgi:hypothetical protein